MNTSQQTLCPSPDQLARLVSGSLIESEAERLFAHIDRCTSCQFQVDEFARKKDPVIAAARNAVDLPVEDPGLSKLIVKVTQRTAADDTRDTHQASTKSISPAEFVEGLKRSGLINHDQLSQVLNDLSWDETDRSGDSGRLARALIRHQMLTPFQAKHLMRGRWKGLVLGNYAILDKLGQGGMGSVFKARHTRMGRTVCLKVVNAAGRQSPQMIDRFRNEARALAALSHPNIVVAHDADEAKGIPYLVMEYIDGDDLAKRVRQQGPLAVAAALEVGIQTARALRYAHGQGLIHRDVKPHNLVMITNPSTGDISLKVLDLGLARFDAMISDNPDASVLAAMTNTGVVIGTVDYMAPEQALDSRNADARSDIYSLGCTLFFLLTGRPPFSGETVMQRLVAHREKPAADLSVLVDGVSVEFNAVIQKMLAKRPEDRYAAMDQVLADLQAVADGRPASVPAAGAERQPARNEQPGSAVTVAVATGRSDQTSDAAVSTIVVDDKPLAIRRKIKPKRPLATNRAAILVAGVLAAVSLTIGTAYLLLPPPGAADANVVTQQPPPPRQGAAEAIRNGGDGRALVLVSSKHFQEDEFTALASALDKQGVKLVVASSKYGTGQSEAGAELKAPFEKVSLTDVVPTEFDSVFVLGGDNHELTHKNPKSHEQVKRIVEGALQNNITVTGCTSGYHQVLKDTGLIFREEYRHQKYKYDVCSAKELGAEASKIFSDLKWKPASAR